MATYAVSDLHGQKDLLIQIQKFLKSDDKVYFLGDAADRGPDGWEMIKMILKDSRFEFLKGNHEDMLVQAAKDWFKYESYTDNYHILAYNGGGTTFYDMTCDEWASDWIRCIDELSGRAEYINTLGWTIYLSHAGFTPRLNEEGKMAWVWGEDLIWNREHFLEEWDEESFPQAIVVHGHTPIPYVVEDLGKRSSQDDLNKPYYYCNQHKICIDNGAFATKSTILLNLDTFEYHIFSTKNK